jgi:aldehyde:ferredoxin oxidoreductase
MNGKGPEFESLLLGTLTEIFDLETVTHANYHCNLLGLDTITTAGTIACAMELQELGALGYNQVHFGNKEILVELVKQIATKNGIGLDLALGSSKLADKYGHPESAMHVKGMELPAYDPRGAIGQGIWLPWRYLLLQREYHERARGVRRTSLFSNSTKAQ